MDMNLTAARLEALGHVTRLAIYRALVRAGNEGLAVGDVQGKVGVPLSTVSHHLRKLVLVGLVSQERRGTNLICRADFKALEGTLGALVRECCADAGRGAGQDAA